MVVERDRFGGWTAIALGATDFFRLERTERRDWLVTPEGNAFLSFGGNHVQTSPMRASYNRVFWEREMGIGDLSNEAAFLEGFGKKVRDDLSRLGWNTLGCHSSQRFYPESFVPYVCQMRFVDICHYMHSTAEDFWDVFSDAFVSHCDARAREIVLPRAEDPFLLGYSMTDCPIWTDEDAAAHDNNIYGWKREGLPTWPRVLRNLGPDSPGKQVYVETMRELYNGIQGFNCTYGTTFETFGDLLREEDWRPETDPDNEREKRDNLAFLKKVVDQSYRVEVAAIRKYDKNHLIFGDKLNGNTHNDIPDDLIRIAAEHFDVLFYQYYALWDDQEILLERFARLTDKPMFHGDSACSVPNERMPDPFGPHCSDQKERVMRFREMFYNAYRRPDFVGWNWCGWMDAWASHQPGKQHSGVQDPFGAFYPIQEAMQRFSSEMYEVALGSERS